MIVGIGTDIVAIKRMQALWQRHGERGIERILAHGEREACRQSAEPARFLAKRFAAKEALGKAVGSGIRAPLVLSAIEIIHDVAGKPEFRLNADADALFRGKGWVAHLSISDEQDYAISFVVLEQP
jgi:holo-[acyl-carrier protein] synthase